MEGTPRPPVDDDDDDDDDDIRDDGARSSTSFAFILFFLARMKMPPATRFGARSRSNDAMVQAQVKLEQDETLQNIFWRDGHARQEIPTDELFVLWDGSDEAVYEKDSNSFRKV